MILEEKSKLTSASRLNLGKQLPHYMRKANWLHRRGGVILLHFQTKFKMCSSYELIRRKQFEALLYYYSYCFIFPPFAAESLLIFGMPPLRSGCHSPLEGMPALGAPHRGCMESAGIL